ncbi:HNH endonuclease [Nocardia wallacei]|uniref:HNH endonuclease n=1 Tax=Nocardia wallacei TaxID=480035 RepID=UPI002456CDD5|nr:HNH endonuclease signature motif containing protein [Nocardia wallacei]
MPKAPRRCPTPGCTNLIRFTEYCDTHTEAWAVPSGWVKPPGWDRIRQTVLERDDYRCHICGRQGADTVDHITPVSQGGTDAMHNLGPVHDRTPPHCHRAKTNQDRATGPRSR